MNQYEAANEIAIIIPTVKEEIFDTIKLKSPFAIIEIFTHHIKKLIEAHNQPIIDKCLKVMEKICEKGDLLLRNAVENVFIFSLDSLTGFCKSSERELIMSKMPLGLYTAYINQIYKSGI